MTKICLLSLSVWFLVLCCVCVVRENDDTAVGNVKFVKCVRGAEKEKERERERGSEREKEREKERERFGCVLEILSLLLCATRVH